LTAPQGRATDVNSQAPRNNWPKTDNESLLLHVLNSFEMHDISIENWMNRRVTSQQVLFNYYYNNNNYYTMSKKLCYYTFVHNFYKCFVYFFTIVFAT